MNFTAAEKLLRRYSESIRRNWLSSVRSVDGGATAQVAAERFADRVIRLAIQAGYREADHLGGTFDPTLSADRFRVERGALVTRFMTDVQRAVGGTSVGLSARQRRDLRAFAATLQRATLDTLEFGGDSLYTTAQARTQGKRVERAMLNMRARTIGRTEGMAALNLGVDVAVEQTETLVGEPIRRTWRTAADEKVRSSHSGMNGQSRPINEPFLSGNGVALMRPGDPNAPASERANCRCMLITEGG